jgi:peptidoglycan/LPS O-acetylase OafA/YrhL
MRAMRCICATEACHWDLVPYFAAMVHDTSDRVTAFEGALLIKTAAMPRYRAFGLLRFALALVVVIGHASWLVVGSPLGVFIRTYSAGSAAVMTFFALSGFILCEAALTFYQGRPIAFLRNRAIKILPTFFGALTLSLAIHLVCSSAGLLSQGLAFEA